MPDSLFKKSVTIVTALAFMVTFQSDLEYLENNFYRDIQLIQDPSSYLVLVNKRHRLPTGFIPNDLETISSLYAYDNKQLRREAVLAFEQLSRDAQQLGYWIVATSAYRDYLYQEYLYQGYVEEKGFSYADRCSARPGHSEHQTGLALDVMGSNHDYNEFEHSPEFPWMRDHAHQYGFILRYPKGKEHITGFKYEPWHYRYVGVEVAKRIYDEQLTLEEYDQKYVEKIMTA